MNILTVVAQVVFVISTGLLVLGILIASTLATISLIKDRKIEAIPMIGITLMMYSGIFLALVG